ncbi:MAG: outer membrane protein transport protein [bacterium]
MIKRKIYLLFICIAFVFFTILSPALSQDVEVWTTLGPYGGHIYDIAIDPTNPDKMFAGSYKGDGLFVTLDGGNNWQPVETESLYENEDTFKNHAVWAVKIAASNNNVIWVAHNIWVEKSMDGGQTWTHIRNDTMQQNCDNCGGKDDGFRFCYTLAVDPSDPQTVYVGTGGPLSSYSPGAIFKTSDGGVTWTKLNINHGPFADTVYSFIDISIDPNNPDIVYALTSAFGTHPVYTWFGTVFYSEDGGETWGIDPYGDCIFSLDFTTYEIEVQPNDPNSVFLGTYLGILWFYNASNPDDLQFAQLGPWADYSFGEVTALTFDPQDPNTFYASWKSHEPNSVPTVVRTTNSGSDLDFYDVDYCFDVLAVHPTNNRIIFGGDMSQGVCKSEDYGKTWDQIYNGINAIIVYDVQVDPSDPTHLIAGTVSGIYEKKGTGNWEKLISGSSHSLTFHPTDSRVIYAGIDNFFARTEDGGKNWELSHKLPEEFNTVMDIAVDSSVDPNPIYIAASSGISGAILKSLDNGDSFSLVLNELNSEGYKHAYNAVAIDPSDSRHIFAGTGNFYEKKVLGDLWESADAGVNWRRTALNDVVINDLVFDPQNPDIMYAGCGYSGGTEIPLYKSVDRGATWKASSEGIMGKAKPLYSIWGTSSTNVFAVGTNGTILHYDGTAWTTMNSGTTQSLYEIWGTSSEDIFAVGSEGAIVHFDGSAWSEMISGTDKDLNGVWGTSAKDVFAVGAGGTILYYNGNTWSEQISNTTEQLNDVWGSSTTHIFAVGNSGTILRLYEGEWNLMSSGTTEKLSALWGTSSTDIIAVGGSGIILRFDGDNWSSEDSGARKCLNDIWLNSASDIFAIGDSGAMLHFNGTEWTITDLEIKECYTGIWGSSSKDVFAVGQTGAIIHYNSSVWSAMKKSGSPYNAIADLALHREDTNIVYAATVHAGIYISPNKAGEWLNLGIPDYDVFAISAGSLYAATEGGLIQCTGTGVIAGSVTDALTNKSISNARIFTDLGIQCLCIDGDYMMISPAGVFDVIALVDNDDVEIKNDISVYGGNVSWVNFLLHSDEPRGLHNVTSMQQSTSNGGDYCMIATVAYDSPLAQQAGSIQGLSKWLACFCILIIICFFMIFRSKSIFILFILIIIFLIFSDQIAYGATIFEQIGIASSPVPVGSGARALGMGGAFIAIADDATAASWNPAGLIQLEKPEFSIVGAYLKRKEEFSSAIHPESSNKGKTDNSHLNYFSLTYPFRFYKNMVVSINYQRLLEFQRFFNYRWDYSGSGLDLIQDIHFRQDGYVGALGIAGAVEISPRLSFGATLNIWTDELMWRNGWDEAYTNHSTGKESGVPVIFDTHYRDEYSCFRGINLNLGLLWEINRFFILGAVVKTPFKATLFHKFSFMQSKIYGSPVNTTITDPPVNWTEEVELKMPISYGLGWSMRYSDTMTIDVDIYRTHWSDYILTDDQGNKFSPIDGRPESQSNVKDTTHIRVGGEYLFINQQKRIVVPIRTGLFLDQEPSHGDSKDFYGIAAGAGIAYKSFIVDAAYQLRWGNNVDTGNLIDTSEADIEDHNFLFSIIVHF